MLVVYAISPERGVYITYYVLRYSLISKPTTTISYLSYGTCNLNPSTIIADRSSLLGLHQQYCIHTTLPGNSPIGIIRWTFAVLECDHTDTRIGNIWPRLVLIDQRTWPRRCLQILPPIHVVFAMPTKMMRVTLQEIYITRGGRRV